MIIPVKEVQDRNWPLPFSLQLWVFLRGTPVYWRPGHQQTAPGLMILFFFPMSAYHLTNNLEGDLVTVPFLLAQSLDVAREQLYLLINVIRHPNFTLFCLKWRNLNTIKWKWLTGTADFQLWWDLDYIQAGTAPAAAPPLTRYSHHNIKSKNHMIWDYKCRAVTRRLV